MPLVKRRMTVPVKIGAVTIGGNHPIVVQSMTNTDTADVEASVAQIKTLANAGSEIVRITVNNEAAAKAVPIIRDKLAAQQCYVPLVGDFHYNGHRLLNDFPECAIALDKYRINPGNVGFGDKRDKQFAQMIEIAIRHDKPVRIGVNWGSLDQSLSTELMNQNALSANPKSSVEILREALVLSAIYSADFAEKIGMAHNKIILACKTSDVQTLVKVYQDLSARCDYPLHLGLTEAGMGSKGIVATTAALSLLLQLGIGDTIRASLTPEPGGDRTLEVRVCQQVLQALDLRHFSPAVSACPGCGRTTNDYYQHLAKNIETFLTDGMPHWRKTYRGVENLSVAVMGCIVNGPGESKHANIGISLPGTGEDPVAPVFMDGKKVVTLRGDNITEEFKVLVEKYIEEHYAIAS